MSTFLHGRRWEDQPLGREPLRFASEPARLVSAAGEVFDPWDWSWSGPRTVAPKGAAATPREAVAALHERTRCCRFPIAVIGSREASAVECERAFALGEAIGALGLTLLCGGKRGVMEAAARGASRTGGLTIGLLPEEDWRGANEAIAVPIATGIGRARSSPRRPPSSSRWAGSTAPPSRRPTGCTSASPVLGLQTPPALPGLRVVSDVDEAMDAVCRALLGLPDAS